MPLRFQRFARVRAHLAFRFTRIGVAIAAAALAVAIVTTVTVDLGPGLRALAEREGSRRIQRPMHIGSLSVHLLDGKFVLTDFMIEGLVPTDRPFLRAKRLAVSLSWQAMFHREVLLDSIEMTGWQMVVEQWQNGIHSFPKFTSGPSGPRRFVTTLQYVRASDGEFTFDDHSTPWSTVARNLDVTMNKVVGYRGQATFSNGMVTIQNYVPMRADMKAIFSLDGGVVHFDRIALTTDGAESIITGDTDIGHWPEQSYRVRSTVDFHRMREIFFAGESYTLSGEGHFNGLFHLYRGGRALTGSFDSDELGLDIGGHDYRFPSLSGKLAWLPDRFDVTDTSSQFHGGTTRLKYSIAPLGAPQPARARFDAEWENVNLGSFTDFMRMQGIRFAGRWTGRNHLEWPLGRFKEHAGDGAWDVAAPSGPALGYVPISGHLVYRYERDWFDMSEGRFTTPSTDVAFAGRTAWGDDSHIPFHVVTSDLQESDRVLAGIMTAFGAPTGPIAVGGSAEFTGTMLESFSRPRVEGTFVGENVRAFDVNWGSARAGLVIQNSYADVADGRMHKESGEILVDGRFSLGFPRRDRGEEMNGRVRVTGWTASDFKHAFNIDEYKVQGTISGEYHLYGPYQGPFGFGTLTIVNGVAYGEPFETASGSLRFEGNGVRIDGIQMKKGSGAAEGAAFVGWNGTYSFNADGRRIPLEAVAAVRYPQAPLTGLMDFSADGSGTFASPRYQFRAQIRDLFMKDEGIGDVSGRLEVRGTVMTMELEAASPRLAVSGTGRVELTEDEEADLTLRFTDTSLDPYVRAFQPNLSPFTTAVASGTLRITGALADPRRANVDANVEQIQLKLFDYAVRNAAPIRLSMTNNTIRMDDVRLAGDGTELAISGSADLDQRRLAGLAKGSANLGILQGFYRNVRSSGQAQLVGQLSGTFDAPVLLGQATISDGRFRYVALPHSLEAVNGAILFDSRNIRFDGLTARLAEGEVSIDGRVGLNGYAPSDFALTATGRNMRLRYPQGVRSEVDADLALTGRVTAPVLSGTVNVQNAVWTTRFETNGNLFDFSAIGGGTPVDSGVAAETVPLRLDVRVTAPGTLRIENSQAHIASSADLTFRGTYERPIVFGRVEVNRGEFVFEGRRYVVTRGAVDFTNPVRIEPVFDVSAETQVRVPTQTYRVTLRATGTMQRLHPEFSSDPPLPALTIASLLLGDVTPGDAELLALQKPESSEQQLIQARAARLLTSPISGEIGKVVEQTFGVDTFQLTPLLGDPQLSSRFNPTARLTIGKRISTRAYLTFTRSLNTSSDQIILLEYDQTDRMSWVLTRNEDNTYAVDIRVRKEF